MFFGWYVVAGTFVSQMFLVGFFTYSFSLIIPSVREDFGVSMAEVMYSLSFGTFLGMFLMPLAGVMLDRFPVRWIIAGGTLLFACGLWLLTHTTTITEFIVVFGLTMAIANVFAGPTASSTTISRWFTTSRGRALGISAMGTSVGGVVIPVLVAWWVQASDWRSAVEGLALCVAFIVLPFVVLTIRGKPSEIGAFPEGGEMSGARATTAIAELKLADIIRLPGYWYIGLTMGLLFSVYASVLANITPYATGLGTTAAQASTLIMSVAITGLAGKLVFGMLADKLDLKLGLWAALTLVFVAFLILASEPGYPLMLLATGLMGLAAGGMLPVWGAMMAKVFGLLSYGRAMGLMGPLITLLSMPGFVVIGKLFDATGSYQLSLLIFSGLIVVAMLLLLPLKLPIEKNGVR